ncbi:MULTISPECIES: hypothetical protein [Bacillaceae]|uniref:hypothetical protein n=1 Tax=Bacillaceae TaxID=186817 RepID=UPI0015DF4198|nr:MULTISPECIES: hypothetical protein [Bacillaceae]QNG61562.1 hypothetical protein H4O14_08840 [Bacillus sp. PAMC26568]
MFWLLLISPLLVIGAIAIFFEKKSGMSLPDESKQDEHIGEVISRNSMNTHGGN